MTTTPDPALPNRVPADIACRRCGTVFHCGAGGKERCWCVAEPFRFPVPVDDKNASCYCSTCLRALAAEGKAAFG